MHPLLVSAVASTAGNFLDRWARGAGAPATAPTTTSFQSVLDAKTSATAPTPLVKSAAELTRDRVAKLRDELLEAPEIRAVLDTADPTKPAKLSLTPDGRVLCATPGRDARPLQLAPDTAAVARELAALTTAPASQAVSAQYAPGQPAREIRGGAFELTPQTGITARR
jgi:hypothetical protein